jgi:hypothetical protein
MRDNLHVIIMSAEHGFLLWLNNTDLKVSGKQSPQESTWTRNKEVGCLKVLKKVKSSPLYRHWGSVQAVRPIGGVEV